jgi:hypothetical protein
MHLVEVKGYEVVDVGVYNKETVAVGEGSLDGGDWRNEVGLMLVREQFGKV